MKTRDILVGFVVLVMIISGVLWVKKTRNARLNPPLPTPNIEEKVTKMFNFDIPEGAPKAELNDVSGGNGSAIATRDAVLADLPEAPIGFFYQVWVEKDSKLVSLGKMRSAKGGFLFDGNINGDRVIVSLEKSFDSKLETKILEGSF